MNPPVQGDVRGGDRFVVRLAWFYAAFMAVTGIQVPFFPLWLETRSILPYAIGIILAVPICVRILAVPLISRIVDRRANTRDAIVVTSFASVVCYAILGLAVGFAQILLAVAFAAIAFTPIGTLADAYAVKGLAPKARPYGSVRLWGSTAFLIANLCAGALLSIVDAARLIWIIVFAAGAVWLCALWLPRLENQRGEHLRASASAADAPHLWRSPRFLVVAVAASLIQSSHAVYYGFSAINWTAKGFSHTAVGILWAAGVAAEIGLFAISGRLKISPLGMIGLGGAGAVLRWLIMSLNPPGFVLPAVQCLHALSFGATHLGSVLFAAHAAKPGQSVTAQADFGTVLAFAGAIATAGSGFLYGALADRAYLAMAAMSLLGSLLAGWGRRLRH